jgi:hypothetical protein
MKLLRKKIYKPDHFDAFSEGDCSSTQLSLPESIDDSLTVDGFPIIPNQGSTAEARLYFAQLQESTRIIEKLQMEQRSCLNAIQNGTPPTDDEFEMFRAKPIDKLTFSELFWKIVYDAVKKHKEQYDLYQQIHQHSTLEPPSQLCSDTANSSIINRGFDAQIKIQELQSTLQELKAKYICSEKSPCINDNMEEMQDIRNFNKDLQQDCEKYQRSLIECQTNIHDLERKIQVLEADNNALQKKNEQYIAKLDQSEDECRMMASNLRDTTDKLNTNSSKRGEMHISHTPICRQENADLLSHLKEMINSVQSELQGRNLEYSKLELLYDEKGKQMNDYRNQIERLNEQIHVLTREFENLEKESLIERKRLRDEITKRDEQLDMFLESKMAYDTSLVREQETSTWPMPNNISNNCRHLLAHTVVLGKRCQELQIKVNELETLTRQQKAAAENSVTEIRCKTLIQSLEERVAYLQKTNEALIIEKDFPHPIEMRSSTNRCFHQRGSSGYSNIHHVFMLPPAHTSRSKTVHEDVCHDDNSIHLQYRGPGSFRARS